MTDVFEHPWLGGLFGDEEIAVLWSAKTQLGHYRAFEMALAKALETCGRVTAEQAQEAAEAISKTKIDIASLANATARDGVPIPDFVRQLRVIAGSNHNAIHTGATSQDVLDTALSLTLRNVTSIVLQRLEDVVENFNRLQTRHGSNSIMGRTRMQAALPITASDRIENWRRPLIGHIGAFESLRARFERLQLGGAVGTRHSYGADGDGIAAHMSSILNLENGPAWHTDRTAIIEYTNRLSLITGSLGKLGQDIALMAQQGIDEIVLKGGGGSSAMPHKSNPVLAELLVTLARFNATQVSGMHQTLVHEQERSGAAWMLEWMLLPPMTIATGRALLATQELVGSVVEMGNSDFESTSV